jgi:hypothetical protein
LFFLSSLLVLDFLPELDLERVLARLTLALLSPASSDGGVDVCVSCTTELAVSPAALLDSASMSAESSGSGSSADTGVDIKTGDDEPVDEILSAVESLIVEVRVVSELLMCTDMGEISMDESWICCLGKKRLTSTDSIRLLRNRFYRRKPVR